MTQATTTPEYNPDDVIKLVTFVMSIIASIVLVCLLLLQTDGISRRILSPMRLRSKRRNEQRHRIDQAIANQISSIRQYINGGENFEADAERCITDSIWDEEDVDQLIQDILMTGPAHDNDDNEIKYLSPLIVGISLDLSPKSEMQTQDWCVYLAFPQVDSMGRVSYGRRVQTPLVNFGLKLATAFHSQTKSYSKDQNISTISDGNSANTDLCFVADATSGLGTHILTEFFQMYHPYSLIIKEPAWMTTFAYLIQIKTFATHSHDDTANILYSLCRLQSSAALDQAIWGQKGTTSPIALSKRYKMAIITLPGQSSTATLLPLLRHAFPHDKFLFCHDTCLNAVSRGVSLQSRKSIWKKERPNTADGTKRSAMIVASMPKNITATIPISLVRQVCNFEIALARLPAKHANVVEAWMTSIGSFLSLSRAYDEQQQQLRAENGDTDLKTRDLSLLSIDVKTLICSKSHSNSSSSSTDIELMKMIKYVTNDVSTEDNTSVAHQMALKAAKLILADLTADIERNNTLTFKELKAIDKCALTHDGIRTDKLKRFIS